MFALGVAVNITKYTKKSINNTSISKFVSFHGILLYNHEYLVSLQY